MIGDAQERGECPVTKESLSVDDLIEVKPQKWVNPRPEATMSVPGVLRAFHDLSLIHISEPTRPY